MLVCVCASVNQQKTAGQEKVREEIGFSELSENSPYRKPWKGKKVRYGSAEHMGKALQS